MHVKWGFVKMGRESLFFIEFFNLFLYRQKIP